MIAKILAVEGVLAAIIIGANSALDGTAQKIVLWGAAGAALLWFWGNVLRPVTKIIRRTAAAVDAFENLPGWQERLVKVERRQDDFMRGQAVIDNGVKAIVRELGIEDQVRRLPPELYGLAEADLEDREPPPARP